MGREFELGQGKDVGRLAAGVENRRRSLLNKWKSHKRNATRFRSLIGAGAVADAAIPA